MNRLKLAIENFWPGFTQKEVGVRFPELISAAEWTLVQDARDADLLLYSCFEAGRKTLNPKDPLHGQIDGPIRLFYTGENVRPDFRECDYAVSFQRDIVDARHLRVPNYIGALRVQGVDPAVLSDGAPDAATAATIRNAKPEFCAYVQGNRVPFREAFVKKLARYRGVHCAGPSLNNTGYNVTRAQKYALFGRCKFAVTFENEPSLGYVTEKLPDALAVNTIPIYWGDPTVALEFDPSSFIHVETAGDVDHAIERVIALDQDDAAYDAMLQAPRMGSWSPAWAVAPGEATAFFTRVVEDVRARATSRRISGMALARV